MGVVAAQESRVEHAGYLYVVHEQGLPGQQTRVFVSFDALPNPFLGHGLSPML